ncbi:hypothetical protein BKA64DRAFT_747724 [Cadophora sp. MPI-SDFR-AT-0126]|nr:hypothetical protein BKA64DRAFT_747724 [Leotiomycetes sp. MPI-SDFR-AT-0126]
MAARAGVPIPQFATEYRAWARVNKGQAIQLTNAQVIAQYATEQTQLYTPPNPPPPPPAAHNPTEEGSTIRPVARPPLAPAPATAHVPLLAPVPGVPAAAPGGANWIGVKHLGVGGGDTWSDKFYEAFIYWEKINNPPGPPPLPLQQARAAIQNAYTASQAVPFALPVPPVAVPAPAVPPALPRAIKPDNIPLLAPDPTDEEATYLEPKYWPRRHAGRRADWSAVKILGSGVSGAVVLWEWVGPPTSAPRLTKVAVKNALKHKNQLTNEGRIMRELETARSEHILKLLVPRHVLTPNMCTRRGLSHHWHGRTWQLVLEYCPGGNLDEFLDMRKARNIRFEERTLWSTFECLVDGCSVLEYGMELGYDETEETAFVPNTYDPNTSLTTVVHRDLKPANIFIGTRSRSHSDVPIFKVLVAPDPTSFTSLPDTWAYKQASSLGILVYQSIGKKYLRTTPILGDTMTTNDTTGEYADGGDKKRYTPESFHPGWNNNDYEVSPICGKFGSHTNVWQIGAIILACFNLGPPEADLPFTPGHLIHGAAPLGRLHGTQLRNQPGLSHFLKDTIHECLYEVPGHRPSLLTLKTRIRNQLDLMALDPNSRPEGLQDIERPEPLTDSTFYASICYRQQTMYRSQETAT